MTRLESLRQVLYKPFREIRDDFRHGARSNAERETQSKTLLGAIEQVFEASTDVPFSNEMSIFGDEELRLETENGRPAAIVRNFRKGRKTIPYACSWENNQGTRIVVYERSFFEAIDIQTRMITFLDGVDEITNLLTNARVMERLQGSPSKWTTRVSGRRAR